MSTLDYLTILDHSLCVRINRVSVWSPVREFFRVISRLGDGVFWYALMLALLIVEGHDAALPVVQMIGTGLTCTLVYKWLKRKTLRPRPYEVWTDIQCAGVPLDKFSFPSGHTLHAFGFMLVALAYYPALVWLTLPFALLVAASRIVLGLHYPSDVLAGAAIGSLIAGISLTLF